MRRRPQRRFARVLLLLGLLWPSWVLAAPKARGTKTSKSTGTTRGKKKARLPAMPPPREAPEEAPAVEIVPAPPREPSLPEPSPPLTPSPSPEPAPGPGLAANTSEEPADPRPRYRAVRTSVPVLIDGRLSDPAWSDAPKETRFYSRLSNPYGQPTRDATQVQVAYDEHHLYIAFDCGYSSPGYRDDAVPETELRAAQYAEAVSVQIDARQDGSNALSFQVTRSGYRADVQMSNGGEVLNWEWKGVWTSAVEREPDRWAAEIAIPWGTLDLPAPEGEFAVGVNFRRKSPSRDSSVWSLMPAAFMYYTPVSYFGTLEGMSNVKPGLRLLLRPYVAAALLPPGIPKLSLRNFVPLNAPLLLYGGISGTLRPTRSLRVDFTVNPDLSEVPPDSAQAKLDRFELAYPEVRPFFANDRALFEMGTEKFQLFYSRRLGQRATYFPVTRGPREEVPLPGAAKAIWRSGGTELGLMNVVTSAFDDRQGVGAAFAQPDQNVTVLRWNQLLGKRRRVGVLMLNRATPYGASEHRILAADGQLSLFDEHLFLSGFGGGSHTRGAAGGGIGQAQVDFVSEQFQTGISYLQVGRDYDPSFGYLEDTGVRESQLYAAYLPRVNVDQIQSMDFRLWTKRRSRLSGQGVFDRTGVSAEAKLQDWSSIKASMTHTSEVIRDDLIFGVTTLAGGRLAIPAGRYEGLTSQLELRTAPQQLFELTLAYTEGNLFSAYRRSPSAGLGLNYGRLNVRTLYELFFITDARTSLTEHRVSGQVRLTLAESFVTAMIVEVNTLDPYVRAQLSAIYRFGLLSSLGLVITNTEIDVQRAFGRPRLTAQLTFTYGMSPF